MHQQCMNPGNVRRLYSSQQGIFEQCFAKPSALVLKVHGKPGQNITGTGCCVMLLVSRAATLDGTTLTTAKL